MLRRVRSHPGRPLLTLFISGAHPLQRRQFVLSTAAALAAPAVLRNALAQEGGLSGKSLTIGCSAALSGPLAGFGTDLRQGAEAAIAQINRIALLNILLFSFLSVTPEPSSSATRPSAF